LSLMKKNWNRDITIKGKTRKF